MQGAGACEQNIGWRHRDVYLQSNTTQLRWDRTPGRLDPARMGPTPPLLLGLPSARGPEWGRPSLEPGPRGPALSARRRPRPQQPGTRTRPAAPPGGGWSHCGKREAAAWLRRRERVCAAVGTAPARPAAEQRMEPEPAVLTWRGLGPGCSVGGILTGLQCGWHPSFPSIRGQAGILWMGSFSLLFLTWEPSA